MDQIKQYAPQVQQVAGTVLTAKGEYDAGESSRNVANVRGSMAQREGEAAKRLADFQAAQMRQNAGQDIAAGSVAVENEKRKADLLASRAIAVAAASGGGTLDPTVVQILQGIRGEGELAAGMQRYNAGESARGQLDQAAATEYQGNTAMQAGNEANAAYRAMGKASSKAGRAKALTSVLSGASKLAATWGSADDKPPGATSSIADDVPFDTYYNMKRL